MTARLIGAVALAAAMVMLTTCPLAAQSKHGVHAGRGAAGAGKAGAPAANVNPSAQVPGSQAPHAANGPMHPPGSALADSAAGGMAHPSGPGPGGAPMPNQTWVGGGSPAAALQAPAASLPGAGAPHARTCKNVGAGVVCQ